MDALKDECQLIFVGHLILFFDRFVHLKGSLVDRKELLIRLRNVCIKLTPDNEYTEINYYFQTVLIEWNSI